MATDNDDEFSGFFGDDSGGFFDEPQEPSSAPDTPESQEEAPPEEPDEDEDDGELNELAGTGAGTIYCITSRHAITAFVPRMPCTEKRPTTPGSRLENGKTHNKRA